MNEDPNELRIPASVVEMAIVEGVTCAVGGVKPENLPQRVYGVQAAVNYLEERGYKIEGLEKP